MRTAPSLQPTTRPVINHLVAVVADQFQFVAVALFRLLAFDRRDDAPRSSAGANHIFVGDTQQIPLLDRQLDVHRRHLLHRLDHF